MRTLGWLAVGVALLSAPGCEVLSIDDVSCPPGGTTLTYDGFGKAFFVGHCNRCHSAATGDREGAPPDEVFDTVAQIRAHREAIFAQSAGPNDAMPIGPDDPPREERDKLAEWLSCGAP